MNCNLRLQTSFALLLIVFGLRAQLPEFTRIDTGTLVQDPGNSQGSSLADFDNDGDIDLLIGNTSVNGPSRPVLLYKNERNGRFAKIEYGDLASQKQPIMMPTATFVDIDNDGDWDVSTPCVFYMNDGYGQFTRQYMNPGNEEGCGDQVTSWVDVNNDGYLDCSIWSQLGRANKLFLNTGDGSFTQNLNDPFNSTPLHTECLTWADMDNDGDMDVFASNFSFFDEIPVNNRNSCFINDSGVFTLMESSMTLLRDTLGSGGASWGDYDNDGDLDLYVSTFRGTNHLYRNEGDGTFVQSTIDPPEAIDLGFTGSAWGDFDNDGDLDLFVTSDPKDMSFADFANFNMLFENNGDGSFSEVATGVLKTDGGHSCTLLDFDNDGDMDILIPNGSLGGGLINYLYRNEGNGNHWINITCRGMVSNASAIGTRIYAYATIGGESKILMRELAQQTGLHSNSSPRFHFGLGNSGIIDSLIIRWPSGLTEIYRTIEADQFYRATEGLGLELDFSASNYIEFTPAIPDQVIETGKSVSLELADHFRFVAGDSVPEITGDNLQLSCISHANPRMLTSTLDGSILTLQAGYTTGTTDVKIIVTSAGVTSRQEMIHVRVTEDTAMKVDGQTHLIDPLGQPVLVYGAPGEWDDAVVWNPAVIKDGDTLRMWYTGHNESIWTASTTGKIGNAWSVDGHIWNKYNGNPVLQAEFEWEGSSLYGCSVMKDGDTLKIWYGTDWTFSPANYNVSPSKKIGYAESLDGKTWIKRSEPVLEVGSESDWDSDFIVPHTVIKEENEYKMWFWAGRPGFPTQLEALPQIGLATSPDGIHWTKYDDPSTNEAPNINSDPVLKVGSSSDWDTHRVIDPIVLSTESGYEMWYTGLKGPINNDTKQKIGYARSVDGINWTKWPENPILDDSFTWGKGIYGGSALKFDDTYHFWFACFHTPPTQARPQIGYSNSRDIYIPDPNFLQGLLEADVDTSGNGLIGREEAATRTNLHLNNKGISNLTGLEAFLNLRVLRVPNNKLTKLDVRNKPVLETLDCSNNQLAELNVSNNPKLMILDCSSNQLQYLEVTECNVLCILNCGANALESLVTKYSRLLSLACHDNQLTHLDVSNDSMLRNLYCNNNHLTELDVSQNPRLHTLYCGGNQLSSLDISQNQELGKYDFPSSLDWGYPPWFDMMTLKCDLDIENMLTLYKVCTWKGFTNFLASGRTNIDSLASTDSVYINMIGSQNVNFTTDCSADFIPPVIVSIDTSYIPDSVIVESSEEGKIYLVEEGTEMVLSIIREAFIESEETVSKIAVIPLDMDKLWNSTWWLYACDTSGNLSDPNAFTITGVGVENTEAENAEIYPNPTNGVLTINARSIDSPIIEIKSISGQLLNSKRSKCSNYQLDLSSFPEGFYFITIRSKDFIVTRKVLKL